MTTKIVTIEVTTSEILDYFAKQNSPKGALSVEPFVSVADATKYIFRYVVEDDETAGGSDES